MWFLGVNLTPKSTKDPPDRIFSFSPKSLLYTSTKCSKNKKNGCSGQFWEIGVQSWWIWPISSLLIKIFEIDQTYLPNSLQNPMQLIFGSMKKIVRQRPTNLWRDRPQTTPEDFFTLQLLIGMDQGMMHAVCTIQTSLHIKTLRSASYESCKAFMHTT